MTVRLTALALVIALGGCTSPPRAAVPAPALTESSRAEIYGRASLEFTNAIFFKPATSGATDPSALRFNPLIVQEVADDEPAGRRDYFGRISVSARRTAVDPDRPTVYFRAGSVTLHGRSHEQFTYVWWYRPAAQNPDSPLPAQGIRITLDSAGRPVIWEILADTSGAQIIFVAESLETAAAVEFGNPPPGRRYSIERDVPEAPGTVVARVIADGPAPMGPIVYLRAGTREVGTLTCRCMPDQAKKLIGQGEYELAAFPDGVDRLQPGGRFDFPQLNPPDGRGLERCLRLPGNF